jgi:superfamily II DNA or RNA helicase
MAKRKLPVVLSNRLYIPSEHVTQDDLDTFTSVVTSSRYEADFDVAPSCGGCQNWLKLWAPASDPKALRHCHKKGYKETDSCSYYVPKQYKVIEETTIEGFKKFPDQIGFHRGDMGRIEAHFSDRFSFVDERATPAFTYPIIFNGTLRDYQRTIVDTWLRHGYGIIKAPTASGKSVIIAYLLCHLRVKALLLSHERRHLDVLEERLREFTNINELEKQYGGPILGKLKKGKGDFDITLSTFQAFSSEKGRKIVKERKDAYGFVFVDECHHAAAPTFERTLHRLNPKYRGGTTATPKRKDQLESITYAALGPIVAESFTEMMSCDVTWLKTGLKPPMQFFFRFKYPWNMMISWIANNKTREKLLLDSVVADIQDGRKPLILLERIKCTATLEMQLKAKGYNVLTIIGGADGSIARTNFSKVSQQLVDGTLHAIIGSKVMNENVDIPPLDCLHLPDPSANIFTEEQRVGRVRRPWPSLETNLKRTPIIRVYTYEGAGMPTSHEKVRQRLFTDKEFPMGVEIDLTTHSLKDYLNDTSLEATKGERF